MLTEIEEYAPAKVNIGLKVLPRTLNQAYHQIESIFQTVNLKDRLFIKVIDGYNNCSVTCKDIDLPEENTITLAYKAFKDVSGLEKIASIQVNLEKHIPSGGGLGGGSSDAAALVKALEEIHSVKLNSEQYDKIAEKVGSDVFFFFHCDKNGKGCAIVSGRGEIVNDIKLRTDLHFVLVFPKVHSSTKEAYQLIDEYYAQSKYDEVKFPALGELKKVYTTSLKSWNFVNSFTAPLSERYPEIDRALQYIRQSGAIFSDMSGSGSTVYGIYDSEQNSKCAVNYLRSKGFQAAVAD